ncbi:MAG: MoaD/ThiS family protein [Rhodospirillales bacterium]
MKIRLKLYASLGRYLPPDADRNEIDVDAPGGATVQSVLNAHGAPPGECHLVLVNGHYIAPDARAGQALQEGDHVAAWPPVAGG